MSCNDIPPSPGALAKLREARRGRRIAHSFFGMVAAWLVGAAAVIPLIPADRNWISEWFGWAFLTGVVCLAAWVVIGFPVYWFWPRAAEWWSLPKVLGTGFVGGALPALPLAFKGTDWEIELLIPVIPGAYGVICAGVSRALEERCLRKLACGIPTD